MRQRNRCIIVVAVLAAAVLTSAGSVHARWWSPEIFLKLGLFEDGQNPDAGVCRDGILFQYAGPEFDTPPPVDTKDLLAAFAAAAYSPEELMQADPPATWDDSVVEEGVPDENRITAVEEIRIPVKPTFVPGLGQISHYGVYALAWLRPLNPLDVFAPDDVVYVYGDSFEDVPAELRAFNGNGAPTDRNGFAVADCHVFSPPVLGEINGPATAVRVNTPVDLSASYTFERSPFTRTLVDDASFTGIVTTPPLSSAVWDWGDGTSSGGVVTPIDGGGSVSGNHTYTAPGTYTVTLTVDSPSGSGQTEPQQITVFDPSVPLPVTIDIKPGSTTNPVNVKSKGVVPVAIISTAAFDATSVALSTICFGDAEDPNQRDCSEKHGKGHQEDVNGDGRLDLVLHYETQQTGIDQGDTQACLTGKTLDEMPIQGCDSVRTRGRT